MESEIETNILDLPEIVFRQIFSCFDYKTVYFTFGSVCRRLKCYVNAYVQLSGIFVITSIHEITPNQYSHVLYFLKRKNTIVSIQDKYASSFRFTDRNRDKDALGYFGFTIEQKLLMGRVFVNSWKYTTPLSGHKLQMLQKEGVERGLEYEFNEYNHSQNKWFILRDNFRETWKSDLSYVAQRKFTCNGKFFNLGWCPIGENKFIIFVGKTKVHHSYYFPDTHVTKLLCAARILDMRIAYSNKGMKQPMFSSFQIDIPPQLLNLRQFSVTRISENQFVLIGGEYIRLKNGEPVYESNRVIWKGIFNDTENDVIWEPEKYKLKEDKTYPMLFKLRDHLYIAQEGACDKYNLRTKIYYSKSYTFPYPKCFTYNSQRLVSTDEAETFAIILLNREEGFMLFTKAAGFTRRRFLQKKVPKSAFMSFCSKLFPPIFNPPLKNEVIVRAK